MPTATDPSLASPAEVLDDLLRRLGRAPGDTPGSVVLTGRDPLVRSPHRLGDATAAALGALGSTVAALWTERGGGACDVEVDVEGALLQLTSVLLTRVNGLPLPALAEDRSLFGLTAPYRAGDGRHVLIVMTYPHLRDAACVVLGCPPDARWIADAVARWDAVALEEAINARGGCAAAVRTREEWRRHPQGRTLAEDPLVEVRRIGDAPAEPLPPLDDAAAGRPLDGVRVLDNAHVIAGPVAARMAAELGADVLHLSSPAHPDPAPMIVETGIGKRSAFCDLTDPRQVEGFWRVLDGADVYVSSYRNLDAKGFGPEALVARRPGLVVVDVAAWGLRGPWSARGGFDQVACAATGICVDEGTFDGPRLPPTHLLNDYVTSILAAAGMVEALRRRARDGGSYRVHVDLARISMWVQDLGLLDPAAVGELPLPDPAAAAGRLETIESPWGTVEYLPTQIRYSGFAPGFARPCEPLGASPLAW